MTLEGNIPFCLERFESLQGKPSSIFSNQSKIMKFKVSGNQLEGVLPFSIFSNASSLYYLDLSNNKLEVEIESPSWVPTFQPGYLNLASCGLNKKNCHVFLTFISTQHLLYLLDLSDNSLEGSVPFLYLSGKKINGSFIDCFANGTSPLESLDISDNHVKGSLPENIGYLLPSLISFIVSSNALEGNIPWSFGYLPFHCVDLSHNMLLGTDTSMTMLRILYLSSNHFKGVISPTILNSPNLLILDVQDNDLSGDIPEWLLCQMKTLQVFDISHNHLSGGIPFFLDNITFWNKSSPSPTYWNDCNPLLMMTEIDLSSNQLIGSVPSEMGELSQLRFLNFSINSLTGFIPISFQNLRSMESLDFSHNKLRGRIPSELVGLTSLSVFSVAYNNISGRYPFEHQFSTFTSQCYEGNLELCGDPLPRKCSTANQSEPKEKKGIRMIDHHFFFYAFVTVSYALGFWAFFGILNIKKNSRHKNLHILVKFYQKLLMILFLETW
ncbi:hypothetical protein CIPAW_05G068900 [Carya illinoinensis]|uniref:Uncharacterized protein n=1 Tax=Carya illinoinensis TaxID=32201 RepID=A0A8T1QF89_CARIL|nr:hypothetical protein CIPAW_05G068900 [Carya illinoinensis]